MGQPADSTYRDAAARVHEAMMTEADKAVFKRSQTQHARGHFPAINVGITHGVGTTSPLILSQGDHQGMVDRLLANKDVQRLATFGSSQSHAILFFDDFH